MSSSSTTYSPQKYHLQSPTEDLLNNPTRIVLFVPTSLPKDERMNYGLTMFLEIVVKTYGVEENEVLLEVGEKDDRCELWFGRAEHAKLFVACSQERKEVPGPLKGLEAFPIVNDVPLPLSSRTQIVVTLTEKVSNNLEYTKIHLPLYSAYGEVAIFRIKPEGLYVRYYKELSTEEFMRAVGAFDKKYKRVTIPNKKRQKDKKIPSDAMMMGGHLGGRPEPSGKDKVDREEWDGEVLRREDLRGGNDNAEGDLYPFDSISYKP